MFYTMGSPIVPGDAGRSHQLPSVTLVVSLKRSGGANFLQ